MFLLLVFFSGENTCIILVIVGSWIAWWLNSCFVKSFRGNHYHNITVGSRDAGLFAYRRQLFLDVSFLTIQGLDFFLQLLACHLTQLQSLVQACTDRKSNNIVEVKWYTPSMHAPKLKMDHLLMCWALRKYVFMYQYVVGYSIIQMQTEQIRLW